MRTVLALLAVNAYHILATTVTLAGHLLAVLNLMFDLTCNSFASQGCHKPLVAVLNAA